ncbi:MAG TPA: efflux RND transporter periplasmic adaptor subunit [Acetobacteraceae bacterium]|nr:efflux RND transporter periplasmic adaptor subunit [Acetobacteraceae bacterium]
MSDPDEAPPHGRSGWRTTGVVCGILAIAALAGAVWRPWHGTNVARAASAPASQAVPVSAVTATAQDVPEYLSGLGTVTALNSVVVNAQVGGVLRSVAFTEGQMVKPGQLLAQIDPRTYQAALDQALAKKKQDEAQLANARRDLARYALLVKQNYASRQQLDTTQASVDNYIAAIAGDDAAIEAARLNLGFTRITAPIAGRVGLRQIDPGNLIQANGATGVVTITQINPIGVLFTLPQQDVPRLIPAMQRGSLPAIAYGGNSGNRKLDTGALLTIDNTIDTSTGTIKLKATFPNKNSLLWPGEFVNVRLLITTLHNALTVPSAAVQHGPAGLYVYLIRPDSTVVRQPVSISLDTGTTAVVTKGLAAGAKVVSAGASRLDQGMHVAVSAPPGSASSGAQGGKPAGSPG